MLSCPNIFCYCSTGSTSWPSSCICGSYIENNEWSAWYRRRYEYVSNKRAAFAWQELNDVRSEYGLGPVPLTGFIPNVAEPRKQKSWDE